MEEVEAFLKNLYAAALLYCVAIAFIKFTILAFYWKLFSIAARIPIIILAVSVGCWLIILVRLQLSTSSKICRLLTNVRHSFACALSAVAQFLRNGTLPSQMLPAFSKRASTSEAPCQTFLWTSS